MKTEKRYTSEVCKVTNKITGNIRYYLLNCAQSFERISKAAYDDRRDKCFGVSDIYEATSKTHHRKFTTLVYYISCK